VGKCLEIRRKLLANPSQANCDWGISESLAMVKSVRNEFHKSLN